MNKINHWLQSATARLLLAIPYTLLEVLAISARRNSTACSFAFEWLSKMRTVIEHHD